MEIRLCDVAPGDTTFAVNQEIDLVNTVCTSPELPVNIPEKPGAVT
jgi:hypothetical protein